jgi:hypothetical protein
MKTPVIITALIVLSGGLFQVFAQANENDYYSNDLDEAIKNAKESPAESNIVGSRWYNRSTSKSFNFPKLMNSEMSTEVVDGALDATAAGPGDTAPKRTSPLELSEQEALIGKQDEADLDQFANIKTTEVGLSTTPKAKSAELIPSVFQVDRIEYSGGGFSGSARDIRSEASSNAYITP